MTAGDTYLVDSHCHLNYKGLADDVDNVVERARAADVKTLLTINTKLGEFDDIRAIAERHGDVYCSVGVHPHEAANEPDVPVDALVSRATDPKVVGIGESGLDYYYDNAPREAQKTNFRNHITASRETGLPLIVHTRDADDDTARILSEEMGQGAFPAVIHCFTASRAFAETALDLGFYISLSGIVTFRNATDLQDIARDLPLDRLLVETDAPFLAPVPHRGKPCEPAYVADTARFLADLRAMPLDDLKRATTENFFRLFAKAERPVTSTPAV